MYPEIMVVPMREELTRLGIEELRSAADVDRFVQNEPGTTMVVVNSICGCAAGRMRPAVRLALQNATKPGKIANRVCRTGHGSHRPRPFLFHRIPAFFAFDCDSARRQGDLHDAPPPDRNPRCVRHRRRPESRLRAVLRGSSARNNLVWERALPRLGRREAQSPPRLILQELSRTGTSTKPSRRSSCRRCAIVPTDRGSVRHFHRFRVAAARSPDCCCSRHKPRCSGVPGT
jgi:hypothetical protein